MFRILFPALLVLIASCTIKDSFDVSRYHEGTEADSVLTSIITYLYSAPTYASTRDRFNPEHRAFYAKLVPQFSIHKYFVSDDGTHYYYVIRPAAKIGDRRAVGGYFRMTDPNHLTGFREVFVTPILREEDLKGRAAFLFDEMVKGDIGKYLAMPTYVQWPNRISVYDTITYEWKAIGTEAGDSIR